MTAATPPPTPVTRSVPGGGTAPGTNNCPGPDVPGTALAPVGAFLVAFLLGGFLTGTLGGVGWAASIAQACALGTAGAGLQLMLTACRRRRALEEPES